MSRLFRPEALEARRDSWLGRARVMQPLPVRVCSALSVLLLAACVAYLMLGTYTRRVQAQGTLMPHAGLITVASPAAGLVRAMAVAEGAHVGKGDLLYEIDLDPNSAAGPTHERIIAELQDQVRSLRRERDLKQATAVVDKQALFNQQQNLVQQHTQLAGQIALGDESLPVLRGRIDQLRAATRKGIALQQEYQNQTFQYLQTLSQMAQFKQVYLQLEGKIGDVNAQLNSFDDRLAQALNTIDRDILKIEEQITENEAKRSVIIVAPADGTLTAIRSQAGQTIAAGAPLVTLLQSNGALQADLYVDSAAIGFVRAGAKVLLRYAAFPFQRFGLYEGAVSEVTRAPVAAAGADAGGSDAGGAASPRQGEAALYRVVAVPRLPYVLVHGAPQRLEAGMRLQASIALDTRPLYRWLFDPLVRVRRSLALVSGGGAT